MIEQLILDIKGVLYSETDKGKELCEGAAPFIGLLRSKRVPFLLATNSTSEMPEDIIQELNSLCLEVSVENVASSIDLSADYLNSNDLKQIFLISDNDGLRRFYSSKGIDVISYGSNRLSQAVVVALDRKLEQDTIDHAAKDIKKGARLVALHRNLTRVDQSGNIQPNVGMIVQDLEEITGYKDTVTIGKPSLTFYLEALKRLPSKNYDSTLVVGDDPNGDLSGPYDIGMKTAFIASTKYLRWPENMRFRPDYDIEDLRELMPIL